MFAKTWQFMTRKNMKVGMIAPGLEGFRWGVGRTYICLWERWIIALGMEFFDIYLIISREGGGNIFGFTCIFGALRCIRGFSWMGFLYYFCTRRLPTCRCDLGCYDRDRR